MATKKETTKAVEPKMEKLEYAVTINAGNYESIKLGGEWSVPEGYDVREFTKRIDADMRETALQIIALRRADVERKAQDAQAESEAEKPAEAEQLKKEMITKDNQAKVQRIIDRALETGKTYEDVCRFFDFDEKAAKMVKTCIELGKRLEPVAAENVNQNNNNE